MNYDISTLLNLMHDAADPDSSHVVLRAPFTQHGYDCASDGHRGILVTHKFEFPEAKVPDFQKTAFVGRTDDLGTISTAALDSALKRIPLVDWHYCRDCGGSGDVETFYHSNDDHVYTIDIKCPVCDGVGKIANNPGFIYNEEADSCFLPEGEDADDYEDGISDDDTRHESDGHILSPREFYPLSIMGKYFDSRYITWLCRTMTALRIKSLRFFRTNNAIILHDLNPDGTVDLYLLVSPLYFAKEKTTYRGVPLSEAIPIATAQI